MNRYRYRAHVEAASGTLLGGVLKHSSSWFSSWADASSWLETVVDTNRKAGRYVGKTWIERGIGRAEIKKNPRRRVKKNPSDDAATVQVVGSRVQLHPGTDAWMRGDRYGEVVGVARNRRYYKVKMDKSGKTLKMSPDNIYEIYDAPKKNPRKRRKLLSRGGKHRALARIESGRKMFIPGARHSAAGLTRRSRSSRAQIRPPIRGLTVQRVRGVKRVRKNPTARRASFVVSVRHGMEKDWRKNFHQIAAFNSKPQAFDYARALARANRRVTVKVEKR